MCNKKLMDEGEGKWHCERCNLDIAEPAWRYMLNLTVVDHLHVQWLAAFGDSGDTIMQMPAEELRR